MSLHAYVAHITGKLLFYVCQFSEAWVEVVLPLNGDGIIETIWGQTKLDLPTITPSFCGSNHQEYLCGFPLSQLGKNTPLSESVEIDRGIDG